MSSSFFARVADQSISELFKGGVVVFCALSKVTDVWRNVGSELGSALDLSEGGAVAGEYRRMGIGLDGGYCLSEDSNCLDMGEKWVCRSICCSGKRYLQCDEGGHSNDHRGCSLRRVHRDILFHLSLG